MRWFRRVVTGLGLLVAVALIAVSVATVVAVRRSHPTLAGTVEVAGLADTVTVERDADGVPTIVASSAEDLFRAQGYVHAQDRYWEMDFRRHVTAGRLSELFGASQLDTDRFIRTLGWRNVAEAELDLLAPDTRAMLDAYAAGVNAWTADRTGSALSLEHALLPLTGAGGYRPEPWTAVDSLAWLKAMAWDLRSNLEQELERARLRTVDLGPGRTWEDLFPAFDADRHPPILPWGGGVVDGVFAPAAGRPLGPVATGVAAPGAAEGPGPLTVAQDERRSSLSSPDVVAALDAAAAVLAASPDLLGDGSEGIGSNSWAVAGTMTATGGAMLANDPHLAPALPSIWHQVRLRCAPVTEACPYDVAGFSFSGVPGIIIGHNDRVAWGFTNLGPDVADLVVERLDGAAVVTPGGSSALEVRTETIRVAGGEDVTHEVRVGPNGPLISDVGTDYADLAAGAGAEDDLPPGDGLAVALRWVALDPAPTADAIPRLMRARDFDAFRAAAARFQVPSQNLLYADVDGHIGYQAPGLIPVRDGHDGTLPTLGWEGGAAWTRFLAFDELPYVLDPASGVISTANQLVLPPGTTPFLHVDVSYGQRGRRIAQLLADRTGLTLDDLAAIQMDNHNTNAEVLVPYLLAVTADDPGASAVQDLLGTWDLQDDVDDPAAAAFNATWRAVLRRTFHDELPQWAWPSGGGRWWEVVRLLLDDPDSPWWSAEGAPDSDRDTVLAAAMADAHAELTDRLGPDPTSWRWGELHTLTPRHATFGSSGIAPVEWLFNRRPGPLETAGGTDIVNSNSWDAASGYEVNWVPSMRMLIDLTDLDAGRWIHLTGQSGRPFHPNYGDQAERWRTGGYAPMPFSAEATAAAATAVLTLVPAG